MVAAIIKVDIENNYYKCSGKLYSCTVSRKSKTAANQRLIFVAFILRSSSIFDHDWFWDGNIPT